MLVSRGRKGALVVGADRVFNGVVKTEQDAAVSTVGCGDYLLGGFIGGLADADGDERPVLERAVKAATARAWGWHDKMEWPDAQKRIEVEIT